MPRSSRISPAVAVLIALFAATLVATVLLAVPDQDLREFPDSEHYQLAADKVKALDIGAIQGFRAVLYPAMLAFHQATGLPHGITMGLFNLLGLGVLVWRLYRRGAKGAAWVTALLGMGLLMTDRSLVYGGYLLRESIVPGVTALHLACLVEALCGPWRFRARIGWLLGAMLVAFHLKSMYLYPMALAMPLWLWAAMARTGIMPGWRRWGAAVAITVALVALVNTTNPNNDAILKPYTLVGVLSYSQVPLYYAGLKEPTLPPWAMAHMNFIARMQVASQKRFGGFRAVDPFKLENAHQRLLKSSLVVDDGIRLFLAVLKDEPKKLLEFLTLKAYTATRAMVHTPLIKNSICYSKKVGLGLPNAVCGAMTTVGFYILLAFGLIATVLAMLKRGRAEAFAAMGLCGVSAGLMVIVGVLSYTSFGRLTYPALWYGALSLPMAGALMWAGMRGRSCPPSP